MKQITDSTYIIGPVRFSYLTVFNTKYNEDRECEMYSAMLLIPKTATPECPAPEKLLKDIREAIESALKRKFKSEIPKKWDSCLKDGDVETSKDGSKFLAPGYWFIGSMADADEPPVLIDGTRKPVLDKNAWISGDWGFAKLSFFGYDKKSLGVSTRLKAIQFIKKGDPLTATHDPESVAAEFDEVEADFLA